jgi:hypothetical protein
MSFDDRTADGQAHAESMRFGCVEGLKKSAYLDLIQSGAGILYADKDSGAAVVFVALPFVGEILSAKRGTPSGMRHTMRGFRSHSEFG